MGLFSRKREKGRSAPAPDFDRTAEYPVIRCSICNGEMVAGFKDRRTGRFREYRMLRSSQEIEEFRVLCGVDEVLKEY